jgi:hypothetical protein
VSERHDPTELGGVLPPSSGELEVRLGERRTAAEPEPVLEPLAVGDPWITPEDVQAYHDWVGAPEQRLIDATAAVRAAVERRRSDLDFSDPAAVMADVRLGSIRWAGLIFQARGAPSGFTGYDDASTMFDALGAQRAEIMRLIGWRRPVAL